jgi:hypothetical protein
MSRTPNPSPRFQATFVAFGNSIHLVGFQLLDGSNRSSAQSVHQLQGPLDRQYLTQMRREFRENQAISLEHEIHLQQRRSSTRFCALCRPEFRTFYYQYTVPDRIDGPAAEDIPDMSGLRVLDCASRSDLVCCWNRSCVRE